MSRGHYTQHLDRLTIAVHSPFWQKTHHRDAMITAREYQLVAKVLPGWRGNQRQLAADLGYSLAGLNEAIATLSKLGILARLTHRGRHGWTRLVLVAGVHVRNVRERISTVLRTLRTTCRTFPGGTNEASRTTLHVPHEVPAGAGGPAGGGPLAWQGALR